MRLREDETTHRWSIVLAGGEGERTRLFIEQWLGYHKPKQFCSFVGNRSMLQHTWDRADQLTRPEQKITVVGEHHAAEMSRQLVGKSSGQVIYQPHNSGTAAGIFLPLAYIRHQDPQATVILYPSDHFVFPEFRFVQMVGKLMRAAELFSDRLILLGVSPTGVELDYGWIKPTQSLAWIRGSQVRKVGAFVEKPNSQCATATMEAGGLWNTFVFAAKVETLWQLGWQCLPDVMQHFEPFGNVIGTSLEQPTLRMMYEAMPHRNFSSDVLQRVPERVGVLEMRDVMWSDWGRPTRIRETLRVIEREPTFTSSCEQRGTSSARERRFADALVNK